MTKLHLFLLSSTLLATAGANAATEVYTDRPAFEARIAQIVGSGINLTLERQAFEENVPGDNPTNATGPAFFDYAGLPFTASADGFGIFRSGTSTDGNFGLGYQGNGTPAEPLVLETPVPVNAVGFDIVGFGSTDIDPFDICAPSPYELKLTAAGVTGEVIDSEFADGNGDPANTQFIGIVDLDSPFTQIELENTGFFVGAECGITGLEPNEGDVITVDALDFGVARFVPVCGDVDDNRVVDDADVTELREFLAGLQTNLAAPDNCSVRGAADECSILSAVVLARAADSPVNLPGIDNVCRSLNRPPVDFASRLIGYWTFDEDDGAALNRTPQGLVINASPAGDATRGAGKLGAGALSLPDVAIDGFAEVGSAVGQQRLTASDRLTIAGWIRPRGPGASASFGGAIVSKAGEYELFRRPDGTLRWQRTDGTGTVDFGNTTFTTAQDEWTHVAVVFDTAQALFYKNGALAETAALTPGFGDLLPANNTVRLGSSATVSGRQFEGDLDEIAIWTRALDAGEIDFLYDRGFGRRAFELRVTGANFDVVAAGNQWDELDTAAAPFNLTTDWADFGDFVPKLNGAGIARESGVLLAEVRENRAPPGNNLRTTAVYRSSGSVPGDPGLDNIESLAVSITDMQGNAEEANARVSLAYFPFAEGWIGGHVNANGTLAFGNGVTQSNVLRQAVGRYRITIPGVSDPQASGILFAIDANNTQDNVVSTTPEAGGWDIRHYDNDQDFGTTGQDVAFSFLYIPYDTVNLVAGDLDINYVVQNSTGVFSAMSQSTGKAEIVIPGEHYRRGVLLQEGGLTATNPQDNLYTYAPVGAGRFVSTSYDLPNEGLQTAQLMFGYISFVHPPRLPD